MPKLSQNISIDIIIDNDAIQGVEGGGEQNPYFYKTNLKIKINNDIIDLGIVGGKDFFKEKEDAKNDFRRKIYQKIEPELDAIINKLEK